MKIIRTVKRIFSALAAVAACGTLLLVLVPPPAGAATLTVTTGPATRITQTTATLNGYLNPPSAATSYYFAYGTTSRYGQQTALQPAPAGISLTQVQANITGLSAGTTYHFELVAVIGVPPYVGALGGGDQTFTTASSSGGHGHGSGKGTLKLVGRTLQVSRGKATVALWCFSSNPCRGKVSISGSHRGCVNGKAFALKAAAVKPLNAKLSRACRRLLRKASKHRLAGNLRATLSTGQPNLSRKVTLVPRSLLNA
jgi:hypothetical protein